MLEGRTLDGILAARRRLSIADTVQIGRQVCDALAHAHARGVIHRDLKPSNIFVARNEIGDEMVKLIDLGVAAIAQEQLADRDRKLTAAHEVLGTPEYMAPEQLWGRAIDARTDVYALGMSLYECLTGEVPYSGSYPEVLVQVSNASSPPSVRERRGDVPPALAVVIENALEKEASARFQSVTELARALVAASGLSPGPSALLAAVGRRRARTSEREEQTEPEIKLVKKKKRPPRRRPPRRPTTVRARRRPGRRRGRPTSASFCERPTSRRCRSSCRTAPRWRRAAKRSAKRGCSSSRRCTSCWAPRSAVRFASPITGEMIAIDASVRWTRDGRGKSAVGLEFVGVPPVLRRVVADFIASLTTSVA